jgi:hypothetical protein
MKKTIIVALCALLTIGVSSCRKERTCKCTAPGFDTQEFPIGEKKLKQAADDCNKFESDLQKINADVDCSLI